MDQRLAIRLFIKPYCGWCHEVMDWLHQQGFDYATLDVTKDDQAWQEMAALSGQSRAPVIEVNGHVLADFGAAELEKWWRNMEFDGRDPMSGSRAE